MNKDLSPFLSLPHELRARIYDYYLPTTIEISHYPSAQPGERKGLHTIADFSWPTVF